jgi:RNA polymerase sigma-70 factor (ECF subfamily)
MDTARSGSSERVIQMEAIVAEHETALLRYATRIVNNPTSAQDVVQNVFIKLFQSWQEGTHPSDKLKGWLYRVTHNEAVDYIRRESRLRVLHEKQAADETAGDCPNGVNGASTEDERRQMVLMYLKKLHPREQQVVLLRLEEGMSYTEISRITGRSEGNVGNILHHAVRKLSQSMKRNGKSET